MNNENETQYVKSINGYPIKDETAREEIASIETDIDDKISASENELRLEIANTYATQEGLATTDAKIDTTADAILLEVSQTYETQTGTDTKIASAIQQSASEILSSVSQTYETQTGTDTKIQSAVQQSADQILSSVSQTYATDSDLQSAVSTINQTTDAIELSVASKVGNDEIISKINQSPEQITIDANKISLSGKTIDLTGDSITIDSTNFQVDDAGNITANNATFSNVDVTSGKVSIDATTQYGNVVEVIGQQLRTTIKNDGVFIGKVNGGAGQNDVYAIFYDTLDQGGQLQRVNLALGGFNNNAQWVESEIMPDGASFSGSVNATAFNTTSLLELKKNIEKSNINALDIIKNSEVHEFNYKTEEDTDKKHVGFIIGEGYKTPNEFISNTKDSIDNSSVIGILVKAIQELQNEIEELKANK